MTIAHLHLLHFKNYEELRLDFSPRINCFTGNNGQGKTNILDALYYLSYCKSYFNSADALNIKKGEKFFLISGNYRLAQRTEEFTCAFETGVGKKFKRNKKEYERLADHIGLLPLVMSSPGDILLILEGSETRRRFLDAFLAQFDRPYLEHLLHYQRALMQRNALLKKMAHQGGDFSLLDALDFQLVQYGLPIFEARKAFAAEFSPIFNDCYLRIAGGDEKVSLQYAGQTGGEDFSALLRAQQGRDLQLGYTSVGPHKDDLHFVLEDRQVKRFASQGQQKTFLVALRFAQAIYSASRLDAKPILLLDDIFDKLDESRVEAIVRMVHDTDFGQIFITDTDTLRMRSILDRIGREYKIYLVEKGAVKEL